MFRDIIREKGEEGEFAIRSAGTSDEEEGNPVYPPVKKLLDRMGIDCSSKRAERLLASDYAENDLFIGMDERNVRNMKKLFGGDPDGKVKKLLDYAGEDKDVADPYWTGDFGLTFCDVTRGVKSLYAELKKQTDEEKI